MPHDPTKFPFNRSTLEDLQTDDCTDPSPLPRQCKLSHVIMGQDMTLAELFNTLLKYIIRDAREIHLKTAVQEKIISEEKRVELDGKMERLFVALPSSRPGCAQSSWTSLRGAHMFN